MKRYCVNCGREEEYRIEEKRFEVEIDGKTINYLGRVAVCEVCGKEQFVDEVENYNQNQFEKAFIKENDIIDIKEIEEIKGMYRIGKRPLSIVLELGEQTITRYLTGYVPTKKISDLLRRIKDNPEEYYYLLNKNKDKISYTAYNKSKNAVENILGINSNDSFIEDVAEYILSKNMETTPLVLQKLLYFVEVFFAAFHKKPLFMSECKAWEHGPVYGKIYYLYKTFESKPIVLEEYENKIDPELVPLLNSVIRNFGCYSGNVLSFFTHRDGPWRTARENKSEIIEKSWIIDFASEIKKEYKITKEEDIHFYSEYMFKRYQTETEKFN